MSYWLCLAPSKSNLNLLIRNDEAKNPNLENSGVAFKLD